MTRPDLDAIRARLWSISTTASTFAGDVAALLAYIEELESQVTYTVGETEWAHRIANAEQKAEEAREERDEAEQENVKLKEEFLRLRVQTGRHRRAAALSEERALTAEERLERVTHERDQERTVFEQAMAEAQTDVYMEAKSNVELREKLHELRIRSIDAITTRLQGVVCSFVVDGNMVLVSGEQVAALLEGFIAP